MPWCKKVKNDQKLKSRGGPALTAFLLRSNYFSLLCLSSPFLKKKKSPHVFTSRTFFFSSIRSFPDIDECKKSPCHSNANCTNTIGSYKCVCRHGYSGNGNTTCTGQSCAFAFCFHFFLCGLCCELLFAPADVPVNRKRLGIIFYSLDVKESQKKETPGKWIEKNF